MKKIVFLLLFGAVLMLAQNSFASTTDNSGRKKCCDCKSCEAIKHKCCDKDGKCGEGKKKCSSSTAETCCKDSKCTEEGKKCCTSEKETDKKKSCCK